MTKASPRDPALSGARFAARREIGPMFVNLPAKINVVLGLGEQNRGGLGRLRTSIS
jgi:hypothetical protein